MATPKKTKETKKPTAKSKTIPPPKKTHKAKNPTTKNPSIKKTQQTKNPTAKKTHKSKNPTTKKPSKKNTTTNANSNGNVADSDVVEISSVSSSSSESRKDSARSGGKITKAPTPSKKRKQKQQEEDVVKVEEVKASYTFPMERVKRIIRSEDSDLRISHDAVFLINKATEKFLDKFCEDAVARCVKDKKKSLHYKHLSSVVSKQKRYDFLSDYVPQKVKAEDALAKRKLAEAKAG